MTTELLVPLLIGAGVGSFVAGGGFGKKEGFEAPAVEAPGTKKTAKKAPAVGSETAQRTRAQKASVLTKKFGEPTLSKQALLGESRNVFNFGGL